MRKTLLTIGAAFAIVFSFSILVPSKAFSQLRSVYNQLLVAEETAQIGLKFSYGFDAHIATVTFTGSGSTSTVNGVFSINSGASTSSSARLCSRRILRYQPGIGAHCIQTAIFADGVEGSVQRIGCVSRDFSDGYGFGFNGEDFGIFRSSGGFTTWVSSSNWNVDKMDGRGRSLSNLITDKGSIYSIRYQWLGFGTIQYGIQTDGRDKIYIVHEVHYAGTETSSSSENPSHSLCAEVLNTTNNTNLTMGIPSHGAFIEGREFDGGIGYSTSTVQDSVAQVLYPILTIRSTETFRGKTNRITIGLEALSFANESVNRAAEIIIVRGAVLTGASWIPHVSAGFSVVDIDQSATSMSGGEREIPFFVSAGGHDLIDLVPFDILVYPGERITIAAVYDQGSATIKIGLRWREKY